MITDERIASYIDSFNTDYDPIIMTIRREAEENGVPIIRKEAAELIPIRQNDRMKQSFAKL